MCDAYSLYYIQLIWYADGEKWEYESERKKATFYPEAEATYSQWMDVNYFDIVQNKDKLIRCLHPQRIYPSRI